MLQGGGSSYWERGLHTYYIQIAYSYISYIHINTAFGPPGSASPSQAPPVPDLHPGPASAPPFNFMNFVSKTEATTFIHRKNA